MTAGTKIFLAVFAAFVGVLVLYYGVLMPQVQGPPAVNAATRGVTPPQNQSAPAHADVQQPVAADPRTAPPADPAAGFLTSAIQNAGFDPGGVAMSPSVVSPDNLTVDPATRGEFVSSSQSQPVANQPVTLGADATAAASPTREKSIDATTKDAPVSTASAKSRPISQGDAEYAVKSGDTMSSIAEAWFGDRNKWSLIAKANPLVDPNHLRIGQKIRLPSKDARPATVKDEVATDQPVYVVRSGDTLAKIAREYYSDVSRWKAIYDANKPLIGADPADLKPGMKLKLPPPAKPASR